ncbi:hypothetical protein ABD05_25095 [Burkholderia pyrrocinia]|nr:hypothetical protein ABD05_25095 [Burkholderia pyrrocinia]
MARADRRRDPHELVPHINDKSESDVSIGDSCEPRWYRLTARHVEATVAKVRQARAQIEPKRPGNAHSEIGIAMGVDGKLGDVLCRALPDDAFDCCAGLPLVQDDGLVVENAPAIE